MTDPIAGDIGDYRAFTVSHLAMPHSVPKP